MITQQHYIHRVLLRFNLFSLLGVLGGTCPFFVAAVQADVPPQRHFTFDLPAQPLSQALVAYGEITGLSILVRGGLTAGRQSSPVRGEFTADEALRALLAGTRLTAIYTSGSAFTLQPQNRDSLDRDREISSPALLRGAYRAQLQRGVSRLLCSLQPANLGRYRLGMQLWIDASGKVVRVHILNSPGAEQWGADVKRVLERRELVPPPIGLRQPITLLLRVQTDIGAECRRVNIRQG